MNAYGYRTNVRTKKNTFALYTVIRFLRAVFAVLFERISAYHVRVAAVVTSAIIALGLVGGMESGVVPIYVGFPVCIVLAIAVLLTHFDD